VVGLSASFPGEGGGGVSKGGRAALLAEANIMFAEAKMDGNIFYP
jgi:hypothetical protein